MPTVFSILPPPNPATVDAFMIRAATVDTGGGGMAGGAAAAIPVADLSDFMNVLLNLLNWVPTPGQLAAVNALIGVPGPPNVAGVPQYNQPSFFTPAAPLANQFVNFNLQLVIFQLLVRVIQPKRINQRAHPVCGPVVLMQDFAEQNPLAYVNYVMGLATALQGNVVSPAAAAAAAPGHVVTIPAGSGILQKQPDHNNIPQADYIALASLRNHANWFTYNAWMLQGATMSGTLADWMTASGYANVENQTISRVNNLRNWGTLPSRTRTRAQRRDALGRQLMLDNVMLAANRLAAAPQNTVFVALAGSLANEILGRVARDPKWMVAFGGHWVTLKGIQIVPGGGVQFAIRTWGTENALPAPVIPWRHIGDWWRGFVCGVP